jgi:hypothetical protein
VVQKETVAVSSTEAPRLAACKLHARVTALFSTPVATGNDLEVGWNSGTVVENVGDVVACAGAVEVGAKHVLCLAGGILGRAGDGLCFSGGGYLVVVSQVVE